MKDYKGRSLKVGDTVKIRRYDLMVKEFGKDEDGNISPEIIKHRFMGAFKIHCGRKCVVDKIVKYDGNEFARSKAVLTEHGFMCNLPGIAIQK